MMNEPPHRAAASHRRREACGRRAHLMTELYLPEKQSNAVVIMAGGLGTRLAETHGPQAEAASDVGGRPLLETIIGLVADQGFSSIFLSVNYKAEMIMDHFAMVRIWASTSGTCWRTSGSARQARCTCCRRTSMKTSS